MRSNTIATGVAAGLIGAAVAVGVMAWQPWDGGEEQATKSGEGPPVSIETAVTLTAFQPRLTGAEAAAIVQAEEDTRWDNLSPNALGQTFTWDFDLGTEGGEALDFNSTTRAWVVRCSDFVVYPDGRREEQGSRTFR